MSSVGTCGQLAFLICIPKDRTKRDTRIDVFLQVFSNTCKFDFDGYINFRKDIRATYAG